VDRLHVGPSRPAWFEKAPLHPSFRQTALALLLLAIGTAIGGAVASWWHPPPEPRPTHVDEHAIELVLFDAVSPVLRPQDQETDVGPLRVDGGLLLTGGVAVTVLEIGAPDPGLEVRAPALPASVSPSARFQTLSLRIDVRDCTSASRWTPGGRPFTISWRDEYGRSHLDKAGDSEPSMATSLTQYISAVCDDPPNP
jgi:hypothetical protein